MTVDELCAELERLKVPRDAYSFAADGNETYCLSEESDGWHVFYAERGNRNAERVFSFETDACIALLDLLLHDEAIQRAMHVRWARQADPHDSSW